MERWGEKSEDYCFLGSSIIPKIISFNEWDKNAGAFTNLLFVIKTRQPLKQNFMLNCKKTMIKKINYNSVRRYPHLEIFIPNKNHGLLDTPLISIWSQRAENQKFNIEENVMSERVKMPVRHFLRSDYLHIFFYIKFLVFVSLVHQIRIYFFFV